MHLAVRRDAFKSKTCQVLLALVFLRDRLTLGGHSVNTIGQVSLLIGIVEIKGQCCRLIVATGGRVTEIPDIHAWNSRKIKSIRRERACRRICISSIDHFGTGCIV